MSAFFHPLIIPPSLGLEIPIEVVKMPYSPANKKAMMKYENLMNKRYKEPGDGKFEDATTEILEAVSGDSNTDYNEEMEPVAAIPTHLATIFITFDIHGIFLTVIFVSAYYY